MEFFLIHVVLLLRFSDLQINAQDVQDKKDYHKSQRSS